MADYDRCLALLGVPAWLRDVASDDAALRLLHAGRRPGRFYRYPPALLPLWKTSGFTYHGLWCHPLSDRPISWVKFSLEDDGYVIERYRTYDQLGDAMLSWAMEFTSAEELATVAGAMGRDLRTIESLQSSVAEELARLESFTHDVPGWLAGASYDGAFPSAAAGNVAGRQDVCELELSDEAVEQARDDDRCPPWLLGGDPMEGFDRMIEPGRLADAWMFANCRDWLVGDLQEALAGLAQHADHPVMSALVDAWTTASQGAESESIG